MTIQVPTSADCQRIQVHLTQAAEAGQITLPATVRTHLDACRSCWSRLVQLRWSLSRSSPSLHELEQFMGKDFKWGLDSSWLLAEEWNEHDRSTAGDVEQFYESTPWYIYNLVLWEASGQRPDYVAEALPTLRRFDVSSVLDLGAGVGTDALQFAEMGLTTIACEYANQSAEFMSWRAEQRGLELVIVPPSSLRSRSWGVDLVWAMDVIEHLPQPEQVLAPILSAATVFIYDTEHDGKSGGRHPFHYDHDPMRIADLAHESGLVPIERLATRSHLHVFARHAK